MPFHDEFVCELFNNNSRYTTSTSKQKPSKTNTIMIDLTICCDILRIHSILISREGENTDIITHDSWPWNNEVSKNVRFLDFKPIQSYSFETCVFFALALTHCSFSLITQSIQACFDWRWALYWKCPKCHGPRCWEPHRHTADILIYCDPVTVVGHPRILENEFCRCLL